MKGIGIIGAGHIGSAFARALAKAGIPAMIANSRGPDSLKELVADIGSGIRAVDKEEAAGADIVLVAVNWSKLEAALAGIRWNGQVVIDANNSTEAPEFKPFDLGHRGTSAEVFADLVPGARVVRAFSHLLAPLLSADPASEGGRRVLFYSGDDAAAKADVAHLIETLGFAAVDLGDRVSGGRLLQFPGGSLTGLNIVKFG